MVGRTGVDAIALAKADPNFEVSPGDRFLVEGEEIFLAGPLFAPDEQTAAIDFGETLIENLVNEGIPVLMISARTEAELLDFRYRYFVTLEVLAPPEPRFIGVGGSQLVAAPPSPALVVVGVIVAVLLFEAGIVAITYFSYLAIDAIFSSPAAQFVLPIVAVGLALLVLIFLVREFKR